MADITVQELYTDGCQHCKKMRKTIETNLREQYPNVEIEYIDVLSERGQQMVTQYSLTSTPGIIVNGELIGAEEISAEELAEAIQKARDSV